MSALEQEFQPVEVLVCDDGSTDGTREAIMSLGEHDSRVVYLASRPSFGGPARPRNLGVRSAIGDWLAFLDDDDVWMPQKLSEQIRQIDAGADVVATNARRLSGGLYFESPATRHPSRRELMQNNPLIVSTVLTRKDLVVASGGFPESSWLVAIEDYALWLALADIGARFTILEQPLAVYDDSAEQTLSKSSLSTQLKMTVLSARRWCSEPGDGALASAAIRQAGRLLPTIWRRSKTGLRSSSLRGPE
jgi:glycosyltransferase involved in cell wall biosynthesis